VKILIEILKIATVRIRGARERVSVASAFNIILRRGSCRLVFFPMKRKKHGTGHLSVLLKPTVRRIVRGGKNQNQY